MEELKPAEILKAVQTCGASFCTADHHECLYGDDGCIDCVDRLEADFEALIATGDNLIIRRAEPENKPLTLEQLRQMDGEPVWSEYQDSDGIKHGTWAINWDAMKCVSSGYLNFKHKTYGKTWLAYARRLEAPK